MFKLIKLEDRIVLDGAAMIEVLEQAGESSSQALDALGDFVADGLTELAVAPFNEQIDTLVDSILNPVGGSDANLVLISRAMADADSLASHVANENPVLFYSEPLPLAGDDFGVVQAKEIVIVDGSVPGARELANAVHSGAEIHYLDPAKDGLSQVTEILNANNNVAAIHLVAHGSAGQLQLGSETVNGDSLSSRSAEIAQWAESMTGDADILVYGCDVAAGDKGEAFVNQFSQLTGADIAASVDKTGGVENGGDWDLEMTAGQVETRLAFDAALLSGYVHVLPITDPSGLTGVNVWLDGTDVDGDGETDDQSDGDGILVWEDKSGNDNDANAGAGSQQPSVDGAGINGLSTVNLDGNDYLTLKLHGDGNDDVINESEFSVFMVWESSAVGDGQGFAFSSVDGTGANGRVYMGQNIDGGESSLYTRVGANSGGTGNDFTSGVSADSGSAYIQSLTLDDSLGTDEVKAYLNGEYVAGSGGTEIENNVGQVDIGAYRYSDNYSGHAFFSGNIGEVIIFDRDLTENDVNVQDSNDYSIGNDPVVLDAALSLTEGERFQVESYLAAKWGIGQSALTITINDAEAGDVLDVSGDAILAGMDVQGRGTSSITVDGNATSVDDQLTVANLQALLRTLSFAADDAGDGSRSITFTWADGASDTIAVNLSGNQAPVLDLNGASGGIDHSVDYTEGEGAVLVVDAAAGLTDANSANLVTLTVTITDHVAGDDLGFDVSGTSIAGDYNSDTGVLTLSGSDTVEKYQQVLRTITFDSSSETVDGSRSISFVANDGFLNSTTATTTVNITTVNDAPSLNAAEDPSFVDVVEDVADGANTGASVSDLVVDGSITDADGVVAESIAIFDVDNTNGVWQFSTNNGDSWGALDDGDLGADHALLLDGTLAGGITQRIRFVPDGDYNGSANISFRAWDQSSGSAGNYADATSTGGSTAFSADSDTATLTVVAQNDAPVLQVPGVQVTTMNSSVDVTGVRISDVDDLGGSVQVSLSVANGELTLGSVDGLTFQLGDGSGDSSIQFTGAVADINTALTTITYLGDLDYVGADSLQIIVNDLGNTGEGGAQEDTDSVAITVGADTAPSPAVNTGATILRGAQLTINSEFLRYSDVETLDSNLQFTVVQEPDEGVLRLNGLALEVGDSFSQGDVETGRVSYEHDGGVNAADSFRFEVSDPNNTTEQADFVFTINSDLNLQINGGLTLNAQESMQIGPDRLFADAEGVGPDEVLYTLTSETVQGDLRANGVVLGLGDSFTQEQIDQGLVQYSSTWNGNGAAIGDSFRFSITDGAGGFVAQSTFAVRVVGVSAPDVAVELPSESSNPVPVQVQDETPESVDVVQERETLVRNNVEDSQERASEDILRNRVDRPASISAESLFGSRSVASEQSSQGQLQGIRSVSAAFPGTEYNTDGVPGTAEPEFDPRSFDTGSGDPIDLRNSDDEGFVFIPEASDDELNLDERSGFAKAADRDELIASGELPVGDPSLTLGEQLESVGDLFAREAETSHFDALGGGYLDAITGEGGEHRPVSEGRGQEGDDSVDDLNGVQAQRIAEAVLAQADVNPDAEPSEASEEAGQERDLDEVLIAQRDIDQSATTPKG